MWNGTEDKIKVKITWIRHGMTQANGEHRYLGKTDEPLSETGIHLLQEKKKEYFSSPPEFLYTSPMKRISRRRVKRAVYPAFHGRF